MSITWDEHGVPTITAVDDLEACYGFGFCQAVAHATTILELYGIARGSAAALWGDAFVESDIQHARFGLTEHIDIWWAAQEDSTRSRLQAFCDGFNAACIEDPARGGERREALPAGPAMPSPMCSPSSSASRDSGTRNLPSRRPGARTAGWRVQCLGRPC
ncbi:hypothetical protein F4561_005162 [Lipingzhangella halophila]|uniref:Uncharacterized protein n=1 Tax=Lipingzhangella halophila TaxID=1783352 RepID=A0A7W7RM77_9ACTN|nr:hypothetical protein [Lipingzhangella halophila]